ncbi:MAG TPA: c-type cytochrome, partial [Casimicrobiaceae bacterium]
MRARVLIVTLLLSASTTAVAQVPDGRALAAGCASCHRPDGTTIPSLDGRSRTELLAKLRAFRDGAQDGTVMPQLARGYT